MNIPTLEPHCGSWVIVSRATGQPILETFDKRVAGVVNQARYEVLTTQQWLSRLNAMIRLGYTLDAAWRVS